MILPRGQEILDMTVWSFLFLEKNRTPADNGYGTSGRFIPGSESLFTSTNRILMFLNSGGLSSLIHSFGESGFTVVLVNIPIVNHQG